MIKQGIADQLKIKDS